MPVPPLDYASDKSLPHRSLLKLLVFLTSADILLRCVIVVGDLVRFFAADRREWGPLTALWLALAALTFLFATAAVVSMFKLLRRSPSSVTSATVTLIAFLTFAETYHLFSVITSYIRMNQMTFPLSWRISFMTSTAAGCLLPLLLPIAFLYLIHRPEIKQSFT